MSRGSVPSVQERDRKKERQRERGRARLSGSPGMESQDQALMQTAGCAQVRVNTQSPQGFLSFCLSPPPNRCLRMPRENELRDGAELPA